MTNKEINLTQRRQYSFPLLTSIVLILSMLVGCGPSTETLEAVDYTPLPGDDWEISIPEEQGLDPLLVAELYHNAAELDSLYSLLIVKNGFLLAEEYFNDGAVDRLNQLQSVSKSYTSALVGIALGQGCLSSVDKKMLEFFPEYAGQITDPRKQQITIRQMLQMRAGFPWEESDPALFEALLWGDYLPMIEEFPLVSDPGAAFHYSNLTSDWLGVIVARACDTDLKSFATEYLFAPLDAEVGEWIQDRNGNYIGHGELHFTARDVAKFGLLYLNDGEYEGNQIVSADYVHDSLQTYSEDAWTTRVGPNFNDVGYGYQWWSVTAGEHRYNLAWGHGGQQIALLDEFNMVIVMIADPFYQVHDDRAWRYEKANLNLVANFIASLPDE